MSLSKTTVLKQKTRVSTRDDEQHEEKNPEQGFPSSAKKKLGCPLPTFSYNRFYKGSQPTFTKMTLCALCEKQKRPLKIFLRPGKNVSECNGIIGLCKDCYIETIQQWRLVDEL